MEDKNTCEDLDHSRRRKRVCGMRNWLRSVNTLG